MKFTKYLYHVLQFIRWFIFIKIVSQAVKRLKKIAITKKDGDNWKGL